MRIDICTDHATIRRPQEQEPLAVARSLHLSVWLKDADDTAEAETFEEVRSLLTPEQREVRSDAALSGALTQ